MHTDWNMFGVFGGEGSGTPSDDNSFANSGIVYIELHITRYVGHVWWTWVYSFSLYLNTLVEPRPSIFKPKSTAKSIQDSALQLHRNITERRTDLRLWFRSPAKLMQSSFINGDAMPINIDTRGIDTPCNYRLLPSSHTSLHTQT